MAKLTVMLNNTFVSEWLLTDEVLIGRGQDCAILLDDPAASRHHARVVRGAARSRTAYLIEDLNSTNGMLLNGSPMRKRMLKQGDVIRIGNHEIYFSDSITATEPLDEHAMFENTAVLAPPQAEDTESSSTDAERPAWLDRWFSKK